jgi:membrane protein
MHEGRMAEQPTISAAERQRKSLSAKRVSKRHWVAVRNFGRDLINAFLRIDGFGLAKQVAFSVVFATLPTVFVLVSLAALVDKYLDVPVIGELRTFIIEDTPRDAHELLLTGVDKVLADVSTEFASVSAVIAFLLALWGGMGGVSNLIEATNRAYGVRNTRPRIRKLLMTLAMTLSFTAMIVLTVIASFFSNVVLHQAVRWFGESHWLTNFGQALQFSLSVAITLIVLFLCYFYAPDVEHSPAWAIPGAVFGTVAWVSLLQLFGVVASLVPYQSVYGAAGTAIIILYFLSLVGIALILGATINGVLGQRYDKKRRRHLLEHPEKVRYLSTGQECVPNTI